jgi:hypothetical protein
LAQLTVLKTWQESNWTLHDVEVREDQLASLQHSIAEGPWYMHFWRGNEMKILFKDQAFDAKVSDKNTWVNAIDYGKSIGIPEEQLDFVTK